MSNRRTITLDGYGLPYWLDIERPVYPSLRAQVTADVAIVGAGIAGLKVADYLNGHGLSSVVIDARRVGGGASSRNQGCIVTGLSLPYAELAAKTSRQVARSLVSLSRHNQELLVEQIQRHGLHCDYEVHGETSLVRADAADGEQVLKSLQHNASMMSEDGFEAEYLDTQSALEATGNSLFAGGIRFPRDAQFHSGKFAVGLGAAVARLPHVRLFEDSPVVACENEGDDHLVRTRDGMVRARHLFLATNAMAPQILPALTGSLRAERGQVLVTEPLDSRPCSGCFGAGVAWWREIREADGRYRLLFGGGRRRDQPDSLFVQYAANGRRNPRLAIDGFRPTLAHQRRLHRLLAEIFPHLSEVGITHRWGGLQSFTFDGLPVIGVFDEERRIHGMAGFSGLGNSFSNVGAAYLAARIAGTASDVERRFGSTMELLLAARRAGAEWPGGEPVRARSQSAGVTGVSTSRRGSSRSASE